MGSMFFFHKIGLFLFKGFFEDEEAAIAEVQISDVAPWTLSKKNGSEKSLRSLWLPWFSAP